MDDMENLETSVWPDIQKNLFEDIWSFIKKILVQIKDTRGFLSRKKLDKS